MLKICLAEPTGTSALCEIFHKRYKWLTVWGFHMIIPVVSRTSSVGDGSLEVTPLRFLLRIPGNGSMILDGVG